MNGCMRRLLMLFVLACSLQVCAQNISVVSFKLLENDLTANTTGTMERDQNGEPAALIKVTTTEQGFVFDGGMTGIVKTRQEVGEVWVYVPHGIKRITVKHPQLGVLRDYYFPIAIEKAKTYEMVLTMGKVETIVTRSASKQYVIFNVLPTNAIVELDTMPLDVSSNGYAEKAMPYGTYNYRVSCANYHTEAGMITVSAQGKVEVNVTLRPKFGWVTVDGAEEYHGAHVYVDNERIGQIPIKGVSLNNGKHQVRVIKSLYKPYEQTVNISEGDTASISVEMIPNFVNVTFDTDAENEVWVDGKLRGKGKCVVGLEAGEYTVEVKRASHRTVSEVISVSNIQGQTFRLPSPTPIYGILDITSTPSRATVYLDGVEKGQTPLILDEVLIGEYEIMFEKQGYAVLTEKANVSHRENTKVQAVLNQSNVAEEITLVNTENNKDSKLTIKTNNLDNYELYVNRKKCGEFFGDKFQMPSLPLNEYELNIKGKKYAGKQTLILNESSTDVFITTKHRRNFTQSNKSIYLGIIPYSIVDIFEPYASYGMKIGGYIKRWNIEASYNYLKNPPAEYDSFDASMIDLKLGYAFNVGNNFVITPQLGYAEGSRFQYVFYDNAYEVRDQGRSDDLSGLTLGGMFQYQISKYVGVALSFDYLCYGIQTLNSWYGSDTFKRKNSVKSASLSVMFTLPFGNRR